MLIHEVPICDDFVRDSFLECGIPKGTRGSALDLHLRRGTRATLLSGDSQGRSATLHDGVMLMRSNSNDTPRRVRWGSVKRRQTWAFGVTGALVAAGGLVGMPGLARAEGPREPRVIRIDTEVKEPADFDAQAAERELERNLDAAGWESLPGAEPTEGGDWFFNDQDAKALSTFRNVLKPFGRWSEDPRYGEVWTPFPRVVGVGFIPYVSAGHWNYDDSYVWVSDYSWGWVPFHYGRWVLLPALGWSWVPGARYAGAWVSFRVGYAGYNYTGWAPLAPTYGWRHGAPFQVPAGPGAPFVFCPTGQLLGSVLAPYVVVGAQAQSIFPTTRPVPVPARPMVMPTLPTAGALAPAPVLVPTRPPTPQTLTPAPMGGTPWEPWMDPVAPVVLPPRGPVMAPYPVPRWGPGLPPPRRSPVMAKPTVN